MIEPYHQSFLGMPLYFSSDIPNGEIWFFNKKGEFRGKTIVPNNKLPNKKTVKKIFAFAKKMAELND